MKHFFLILSIFLGIGSISAMDVQEQKTLRDYAGQLRISGNTIDLMGKHLINIDGISDCIFKNEQDEEVFLKDIPQVSLNLSRNFLTDLPEELEEYTNIVRLDMSDNKFQKCPTVLYDMPGLREVLFTWNELTDMPLLKQVDYLCVSKNKIIDLPKVMPKNMQLKTLILAHNDISDIPASFGLLTQLKILCLNNTLIKTLPDTLSGLIYLEYLNLSVAKIAEFPLVITQMPSLKVLCLDHNPLKTIPAEFGDMDNLTLFTIDTLDERFDDLISNENRLRKFVRQTSTNPAQLKKELNARLSTWNPSMLVVLPSENKEYNILDLSSAGLTDISDIDTLKVLHITYDEDCNISSEEKLITQVPDLYINLSKNNLAELPSEIGNLHNLVGLIMNEAEIKDVPSIDQLTRLETLSLKNNNLKNIPQAVFALNSLIKLNLANNNLKEIAFDVCGLSQLAKLDISNNQLSAICSLTSLSQLQKLNISDNIELCADRTDETICRADDVYKILKQMTSLKSLHIQDIGISEQAVERLPESISPMTQLTDLKLGEGLNPVPSTITRKVKNALKRNASLENLSN